MDSDAAYFTDVATATLADASTALGLNLIMEGPRPVLPEIWPRFAGPAATMVFAPVRDPGAKAPYSLYDVVESIPAGSVMVVDAAGSPLAAWGGGASGVCKRRGGVRLRDRRRNAGFGRHPQTRFSRVLQVGVEPGLPDAPGSRGERRSRHLLRGARGAWGHRRRGHGRRGRRAPKFSGRSKAAGRADSRDRKRGGRAPRQRRIDAEPLPPDGQEIHNGLTPKPAKRFHGRLP